MLKPHKRKTQGSRQSVPIRFYSIMICMIFQLHPPQSQVIQSLQSLEILYHLLSKKKTIFIYFCLWITRRQHVFMFLSTFRSTTRLPHVSLGCPTRKLTTKATSQPPWDIESGTRPAHAQIITDQWTKCNRLPNSLTQIWHRYSTQWTNETGFAV